MVLKYLIEKEFKQMRRNPIIPRLILAFPCMMMILMPWAANLEIKYNNLALVDLDYSAQSALGPVDGIGRNLKFHGAPRA